MMRDCKSMMMKPGTKIISSIEMNGEDEYGEEIEEKGGEGQEFDIDAVNSI